MALMGLEHLRRRERRQALVALAVERRLLQDGDSQAGCDAGLDDLGVGRAEHDLRTESVRRENLQHPTAAAEFGIVRNERPDSASWQKQRNCCSVTGTYNKAACDHQILSGFVRNDLY